jgi:hypothetical protein
MPTPQTVTHTISAKELAERKWLVKILNGAASWARSKLVGWAVDAQIEGYGSVYRMTLTVAYSPLPPPVKVVPSEQEGYLTPEM